MSNKQLSTYEEGNWTSHLFLKTGESKDETHKTWFTRQVALSLYHGGFYSTENLIETSLLLLPLLMISHNSFLWRIDKIYPLFINKNAI